MTNQISLLDLPLTVLIIVLNNLNFTDIFKLRCTCKYLNTLCSSKIRNDIKKLKKNISIEIQDTCEETKRLDSLKLLEGNLKYKYILRILHTEISLVNIIFRQTLQNGRNSFCLGELIDDFQTVYQKVKEKSIYSWSEMKIYSKQIQQKVTKYLNSMNQYFINLDSIGVQMVDLLNITKNTKYFVTVKYNTDVNTCQIKAKYNIDNVKILNFLPDLSIVSCNNHSLTNEEKALILNFFSLLIRVHNYFFIQDQHYQERIKIYNRKDGSYGSLRSEEKMSFENDLNLKKSEHISEYEIEEVYKNIPGLLTYSGKVKGLWFEINLKCGLNEAPLTILKNWKRIKGLMKKKKPNNSISSHTETISCNRYNVFIKFKKYLSDHLNCINIVQN